MQKKIYTAIIGINLLQSFFCLLMFINWIQQIITEDSFLKLYQLNLVSIFFWSMLAMLALIGLVLNIFCITNKKRNTPVVGFVLSITGYALMLFFMFFLIVPTTLLLLGSIFIYLMNIKEVDL